MKYFGCLFIQNCGMFSLQQCRRAGPSPSLMASLFDRCCSPCHRRPLEYSRTPSSASCCSAHSSLQYQISAYRHTIKYYCTQWPSNITRITKHILPIQISRTPPAPPTKKSGKKHLAGKIHNYNLSKPSYHAWPSMSWTLQLLNLPQKSYIPAYKYEDDPSAFYVLRNVHKEGYELKLPSYTGAGLTQALWYFSCLLQLSLRWQRSMVVSSAGPRLCLHTQ